MLFSTISVAALTLAVGAPQDASASAVTDARVASTAVFWPGEGRSAFVGLRSSF